MHRFRILLALALAAAWLVGTQHCALAAAGLLEVHVDSDRSACCSEMPGGDDSCGHFGCSVVERGSISSVTQVKTCLPPPALPSLADLIALLVPPTAVASPELPRGDFREAEWAPTWHFARRLVALPGAPALNLA